MNNFISNETPVNATLEEMRSAALKHYEQASTAICHWNSFVVNAIKAYNPPQFHTQQDIDNLDSWVD